jgi:short-subunit dehydrogenase
MATDTALVTGASSGIGLELARQFARHDHDLIVAAEDDAIHDAAGALRGFGVEVRAVQVDLASFDGVETLAAAVDRPLAAAALNAGVGVGGPFVETSLDAELRLIDLNVKGTVHLAKRLVPPMVERAAGRLLFTASIASTQPAPFEAVYGGSKAFVYLFAESLRNELQGTGVTVTAVLPGPTETEFFERAGMTDTRVGRQDKDDPERVAQEAYDALMAGKDAVVVGSLTSKLMGRLNEVLPERAKAAAHRRLSEPGSGE